MKTGALAVFCLLVFSVAPVAAGAVAPVAFDQSPDFGDATLIRVFLSNSESTLVSYGEIALVGDRAIFSMPIPGGSATAPKLQLVSIPADRVDWDKTNRYSDAARARHYVSTRAADDYARLSADVAKALNEVSQTQDPARRVEIVENARRQLADWPAAHYNFNAAEVQQLLSFLDETIADLRASSGVGRFSLNLSTSSAPVPDLEPLLPPPTLKEAIEQVLLAARLAESPLDKSSLLVTALNELRQNIGMFPPEWAVATTAAVRGEIAAAVQVERDYQLFSQKTIRTATDFARLADVRAIMRLQTDIDSRDAALGRKRPDMVASLNAAVAEQLEAARRLRLARDHWASRVTAFRRYNLSLAPTLEKFAMLRPPLEDIQALAGSVASTLALVDRLTDEILQGISRITPPRELEATHDLLASAVQLADTAGRIRREAVDTGNINRAWDASSAAAGALLLFSRAKTEIQAALRQPQPQ